MTGKGRNRQAVCRAGGLTRRGFLGTAAATGTLLLTRGQACGYAANEQLQVAVVGLGGRGSGFAVEEGWSSVRQQTGGRIVALCDVNKNKAAESFQRYPDVGTITGIASGFGPGVPHRCGLGRCGRRVTHSSAQLFFCGDRGGPCCCPEWAGRRGAT